MSSFVTAAVRSVAGKITRSALLTRSSRPPASMVVLSFGAMPEFYASGHSAANGPGGACGRLGEADGLLDRGQRRDVDLAREHVDALDCGILSQQLRRLLHEPGGDLAREMRLARFVVWERVEDAERRRAEAQREPQRRAVLRVDDVQRAAEECLDLLLAAGLGFQAYEQRSSDHVVPTRTHPRAHKARAAKRLGRRRTGPSSEHLERARSRRRRERGV